MLGLLKELTEPVYIAVGTGTVEYQSEDCLTLNIVRPDSSYGDLPVLGTLSPFI